MFVSLVAVSSCDFGDGETHCRIKSFFWEDEWYNASYNSAGRLTKLQSDDSKILFYYDEENNLYKADIFHPGDATARTVYTFEHGPSGITRVSYYFDGVLTNGEIISYSTPTEVESVIFQEYNPDETVGYEHSLEFQYEGGNVTALNPGSFLRYTTDSFDSKPNPFKMLAATVGNPAFWPLGRFVFFPVADYDIPYVSRFSANNPITGKYEFTDEQPQDQTFTNTYSGGRVSKIVWTDLTYDQDNVEDYAFKYDCKCGPRVFR